MQPQTFHTTKLLQTNTITIREKQKIHTMKPYLISFVIGTFFILLPLCLSQKTFSFTLYAQISAIFAAVCVWFYALQYIPQEKLSIEIDLAKKLINQIPYTATHLSLQSTLRDSALTINNHKQKPLLTDSSSLNLLALSKEIQTHTDLKLEGEGYTEVCAQKINIKKLANILNVELLSENNATYFPPLQFSQILGWVGCAGIFSGPFLLLAWLSQSQWAALPGLGLAIAFWIKGTLYSKLQFNEVMCSKTTKMLGFLKIRKQEIYYGDITAAIYFNHCSQHHIALQGKTSFLIPLQTYEQAVQLIKYLKCESDFLA